MLDKYKILITGGNGFLGSKITNRLIEQYRQVLVPVRKTSDVSRLKPNVKLQKISHTQDLIHTIGQFNPNVVIHTACCYGRNNEANNDIYSTNVSLGKEILKQIQSTNSKITFINFSTALPRNINDYARTKHEFAGYLKNKAISDSSLVVIDLECQNIFGYDSKNQKFENQLFHCLYQNQNSIELTHGYQKRDFLYIEDAVDAVLFLIKNLHTFDRYNRVQLGSGTSITLREFCSLSKKVFDAETNLLFDRVPARPNEPSQLCANTRQLNELGWFPAHTVEQGLREIKKCFQD